MIEKIEFLMSIIQLSFFITFGLYSIFYVITSIILKKSLFETVDTTANKLIGFLGIVYLLFWICLIVTSFINISSPDRNQVLDRMFGKYWFGFWLQPALWITMSQILRFEKIRKLKFLRIIFSLLFIFTIEQCIILLTSYNFTKNREFPFATVEIIIGIITKIILFLIIVGIYYILESKFKRFKSKDK